MTKISDRGKELEKLLQEVFKLNAHMNDGESSAKEIMAWNGAFLIMAAKTASLVCHDKESREFMVLTFGLLLDESMEKWRNTNEMDIGDSVIRPE